MTEDVWRGRVEKGLVARQGNKGPSVDDVCSYPFLEYTRIIVYTRKSGSSGWGYILLLAYRLAKLKLRFPVFSSLGQAPSNPAFFPHRSRKSDEPREGVPAKTRTPSRG